MAGKSLLLFVLMALCFPLGQSMKCYSYTCQNFTNTNHPTCSPPKAITCPMDHLSLIPPNRCVIQRMTAELKGTIVHEEIRGCTDSLKCRSNQLCNQARKHGNIKHCEAVCCEGQLCNREGPVARHIAADPMSPSGSDLSCYACSTANEPGLPPAINCSHPIKQQCGNDPLTAKKQDRCVTITMSSRDQFGQPLYQEMRHCVAEHYCNHGFCVHANVSGRLTSCKANCCFGNMCNNDGMSSATTPTLQTTKLREVFARQGAERDSSTVGVTTKRKTSKSVRNEMGRPVLLTPALFSLVYFT